ncbi:MAG: hypothetical protein V3V15_01810 [Sphingorhabdus sp.]
MIGTIYDILSSVCLIAILIWGSRSQKIVMITLYLGSFTTAIIYWETGRNWLEPSPLLAINEMVVTAIFLWIAFRSERFWPLPIAATQLIALGAHFVAYFGDNLQSYALGVMQGIWSYPQMLMLLIATYRHVQRSKAETPT